MVADTHEQALNHMSSFARFDDTAPLVKQARYTEGAIEYIRMSSTSVGYLSKFSETGVNGSRFARDSFIWE